MKKVVLIAVLACSLGWALLQGPARINDPSLAHFMPAHAMLFLEAKDFHSLFVEWNTSREKAEWLRSDSYSVFSRSRLFQRLQTAREEFARAAGVPPDLKFTEEAAGKESALALYDIGELHLLYITRLPETSLANSTLWQKRSTFETRSVGTNHFYVRKDEESGRVAAFASAGDYFLLATREDLIAGALEAIAGKPQQTLDADSWFVDSIEAGRGAGDIRMVIDLEKVSRDPRFRTYWVQQNITEMQGYRAAICDLHRTEREYKEERVLIPVRADDPGKSQSGTGALELVKAVPDGVGYYAAKATPTAEEVLAVIQSKLLTRNRGPIAVERMAPSVTLSEGVSGSSSDLETKIDEAPPVHTAGANALEPLLTQLKQEQMKGLLIMQSSEQRPEGVFSDLAATLVVQGSQDWDPQSVKESLQTAMAPGLTTSKMGIGWREVKSPKGTYSTLDGLVPLAMLIQGNYLILSNRPEQLLTVATELQKQSPAGDKTTVYVASFNHQQEGERFKRMMDLMDHPNRRGSGLSEREPEFFSENIASISAMLKGVSRESIRVRQENGLVYQTVVYEWQGR